MNGETHQYYLVLYRNTSPVAEPKTPEEGYHLTEDLVHDDIAWLNQVHATYPNQPWFMYFSTGAIHGLHHTPKAYREKYQGRFDAGWDKYREETFARQKQMDIIPANARLTPRPKELPAWDDQHESEADTRGTAAHGLAHKQHSGFHRVLSRSGWPDFVCAFHNTKDIGPRMLARVAKRSCTLVVRLLIHGHGEGTYCAASDSFRPRRNVD